MDLSQLWQEYKELALVIVGAAAGLVFRDVLPAVWKALVRLGGRLWKGLAKRLSVGRFERRYLEWLREENRFLQVRGIRTRSRVAIELEEVYVSLKLGTSATDRVESELGEESGLRSPDRIPAGGPQSRKGLEQEAQTEKFRLSVGEALQRCPGRIVILGGPGTGKTTLLSYLALKFAREQVAETLGLTEERLPILIPLREVPRTGLPFTAENLAALSSTPGLVKDCPEDFFEGRLESGDCILLLDGMDEVRTEDERRRLAEQIESFVTTYPDNRYVITSRPTGYSTVALAGCHELEICDFRDEDVEAFARQWCLAVELGIRGVEREISEAVARRNAKREAEELVAAIRSNDRVRRLAVNPLLLTIVAMVHRYRATLPNRRVELYDECIEVLLGYWDEAKGIAGQLDWKRKRRVLEPLAYWMHQRGLREADYTQVEKVIAETLPSVGEEKARAAEFLKSVRERSGLLMERALGIYGFSHLTFQEYMTASHLIDQGEEGLGELLRHLQDTWWREVILLYAGMRDATPLIEAILNRPDDLFKNNLFLAGRCLVDVVNIEPEVQQGVVSRLVENFRSAEFQGVRERAGEALVALCESMSATTVVASLVNLLEDEQVEVRRRTADALDRLEGGKPEVVEALLQRLNDQDSGVRWRAAEALASLRADEARIVDALLRLLDDEDEIVRRHIVVELGLAGYDSSRVVEALLTRLSAEDDILRGNTAFALNLLNKAEPSVIRSLLLASEDEDRYVRAHAVDALGELGPQGKEVIEAVLHCLGDEELIVRSSASRALARWAEAEPGIIEELRGLLSDQDVIVRVEAAHALGKSDQPDMLDELVALLDAEDANTRARAVHELVRFGEARPRVIEELVGLLSDQDAHVRQSAALALGKLEEVGSGVVEELMDLLSDEDGEVRQSSVAALGKLGKAEPGVIEELLSLLGDADTGVRQSAVAALGELGKAEPGVIEALVGLLRDADRGVRRNVVIALRELLEAEPDVVDEFVSLLDDADEEVRGGVAAVLYPPLGAPVRISSHHLPTLRRLLRDDTQTMRWFGGQTRVKDVAWRLLAYYSEETGQRIYGYAGGDDT